MRVESFSFGRMTIDGKQYTSDVIVSKDGMINSSWWRKEGHNVHPGDIGEIIDANPEIVIFGTGASGLMKVSKEVKEQLQQKGIDVDHMLTSKAKDKFNELVNQGKRVVLAAHLTC
ncbi:MAG: Mth938-like domain-containing protein [Archaeoglobaceae archaeon]